MSLLGLWHNYKYANILPEEQLLWEEGTLPALLLPVNKMSYSKALGSASSRMQNVTRRVTPGQNKAMPSDPSSSLSHSSSLPVAATVSGMFTASFALTPGRNVWRSHER